MESQDVVPGDMYEHIELVIDFIIGHVAFQGELDPGPARGTGEWIMLLSSDVGQAAFSLSSFPLNGDSLRRAAGWLACVSADAVRARGAYAGADREQQFDDIRMYMVSAQLMERQVAAQAHVMTVINALANLAEVAEPLLTGDPAPGRDVPRFRKEIMDAIRQSQPEIAAEMAARRAAEDPTDHAAETALALEDLANVAAAAAMHIHPGGPFGIPSEPK